MRIFKKILVAIVIVLALLVLVFFLIGREPINSVISQQLIRLGRSAGLRPIVKNLDVGVFETSIGGVEVYLPHLFHTVRCESVSIKPLWSAALSGSLRGNVRARCNGGTVDLVIERTDGESSAHGSIVNYDLTTIDSLSFFGLTGGTLELRLDKVRVKDNSPFPYSGVVALMLSKLDKPEKTTVQIPFQGAQFPASIPPLRKGSFESITTFSEKPHAASIKRADFLSSWGALSTSGEVLASQELALKGTCHLSDDGHEFLGGLLPLISQGGVSSETRSFAIKVVGPTRRPKITFSDS